jgi:hypothetical protein
MGSVKKHERRAWNVMTKDISLTTSRKRVGLCLRSFKDELLLRSLAEIRPEKSLDLVTSRDSHLAIGKR